MQRQQPLLLRLALIVAIAIAATAVAHADAKRPVPDYDGRGNADADAGSWALWIPRVVLSPVYAVHEYAVRRPLGALITRAERGRWISAVHDLVTFGSRQQYRLIPTLFYDFGLSPSVGARFTATGVGAPGNDVAVHAATWGRDWLVAGVRDQYLSSTGRTAIAARLDVSRRPDYLYMGIGPDVRKSDRARYGLQQLEAGSEVIHTTREAQLVLAAGMRRLDFRPGSEGSDPMLADQVRDLAMDAPGYGTPYTALYQRLGLTLDSRPPRSRPGTGVRLAVYGESDFDVANDRRWARYGASLGGAVDLNGRGRTVKLQLAADFVDPFGGPRSAAVPFTELASLGGDEAMKGFVTGWMRGRSTVVAELAYAWPVWFCLDATARISAGNAFGAQLAGFAPDKLRISGDLGITTIGKRDSGFEILVGLGSETIEQGGHVQSFRLAFGTRRGF